MKHVEPLKPEGPLPQLRARSRVARFPLGPSRHRWKRWVQYTGGTLVCLLRPARVRALRDSHQVLTLSTADHWMLRELARRAGRRGETSAFEHIHRQFWSGPDAAGFQIAAGAERHRRFLDEKAEIITGPMLEAVAEVGCGRWLEVGPGTGESLDYWAEQLPGLTAIEGFEINPDLVAHATTQCTDPRVCIEAGDGFVLAQRSGGPGCVFWTYGGVLEYVGTAVVEQHFDWIARHAHPSVLGLIEPLGDDHLLGSGPLTVPYGAERSNSHDYPRIAEQAGLRIRHRSEVRTGPQRWLLLVAETTEGSPLTEPSPAGRG